MKSAMRTDHYTATQNACNLCAPLGAALVFKGIAGAVPLVLAEHPQITLTDALFESVSALTTTGFTMRFDVEQLLGCPFTQKEYEQCAAEAASRFRESHSIHG